MRPACWSRRRPLPAVRLGSITACGAWCARRRRPLSSRASPPPEQSVSRRISVTHSASVTSRCSTRSSSRIATWRRRPTTGRWLDSLLISRASDCHSSSTPKTRPSWVRSRARSSPTRTCWPRDRRKLRLWRSRLRLRSRAHQDCAYMSLTSRAHPAWRRRRRRFVPARP